MNKNYESLARHASLAIFNSPIANINNNDNLILTRDNIHFKLRTKTIVPMYFIATDDDMPLPNNLHSFIRHWQCYSKLFPVDRVVILSYEGFIMHVYVSNHSLKMCANIINVGNYVPASYYVEGTYQYFNFSN